jgi:hypothetical protein
MSLFGPQGAEPRVEKSDGGSCADSAQLPDSGSKPSGRLGLDSIIIIP